MSKKVNKIIALTLLLASCSLVMNPVTVQAKESQAITLENSNNADSSKEVLTLQKAIDYAIENSDTLNLYDTKIKYQEDIDDANKKLDKATKVESDTKEYNNDTRELNIKILKQKKEFDEDKLRKKVTDSYKAIVSTLVQIENLQKQYDLQKKKLDDTKLMNSLEVTTYINVEDLELSNQGIQNNIDALKNTLSNSKASFKNLIGEDVSNYNFDTSLSYSSFKIDGDEDEYFDNLIDEYLKYNKEMIDINEGYADDIEEDDEPDSFDEKEPKEKDFTDDTNIIGQTKDQKYEAQYKEKLEGYLESIKNKLEHSEAEIKLFEKPDISKISSDATGETALQKYQKAITSYNKDLQEYTKTVSARIKYLQTKLSVEENKVALNEQEKNLKDALKGYYALLNSKENEIQVLRQRIDISKRKADIAKQKYDLGLTTKSEYDTSTLNTDNLLLDLRKAVDEYDSTKEKIEKPWVGLN